MKIPKKVKVGGTTYDVLLVDCVDDDTSYAGICKYSLNTIEILKHCSQSFQEATFLHELLHAIFYHCHFDQNEDTIETLAQALHMVIIDNPKIFEK